MAVAGDENRAQAEPARNFGGQLVLARRRF